MCCQGVLHTYTSLEPDEVSWAEGLDLPMYPGDDASSKGFSQPCSLHQDGKCSAYAERPGACVSYQCQLLTAYTQGKVTLDDSLAIVTDARGLIETIQQRTGSASSRDSIWRQIADYIDEQEVTRPEMLLAEQHLAYICRHFEPLQDVQLEPDQLPGMEAARTAMQTARQRSWEPAPHIRFSERGGDVVIVDLDTGVTSALSDVAATIWLALMDNNNLEDIVAMLLQQYVVDEATLRDDLWKFVEDLVARGVLHAQ